MPDTYYFLLYGCVFIIALFLIKSLMQPTVIIQEKAVVIPEAVWWPWSLSSYGWWPYWTGWWSGGGGGGYSYGTTHGTRGATHPVKPVHHAPINHSLANHSLANHSLTNHSLANHSRPWGGASRSANGSGVPHGGGHSSGGGHGGQSVGGRGGH